MGQCQGWWDNSIKPSVLITLCASLIGMSTEQKACSDDHCQAVLSLIRVDQTTLSHKRLQTLINAVRFGHTSNDSHVSRHSFLRILHLYTVYLYTPVINDMNRVKCDLIQHLSSECA